MAYQQVEACVEPCSTPAHHSVPQDDYDDGASSEGTAAHYRNEQPGHQQAPSRPQAIGKWIKATIVLAFVLLVGTVSFLSWMWFEDRTSSTWRRLVLASYAAQAITISGVLIRTALGLLAPVMTAMIAAVVLERRGVALDKLLPISITRYTNSGPQSLVWYVFSPSTLGGLYTMIVAVLFLLTLAGQFSSTLLVLDLQPCPVMNFTQNLTFPYRSAIQNESIALVGNTHDYYKRRPDVFAIFAEYHEPPAAPQPDRIDDTGATVRAFLPIAAQPDRERVRRFQGLARVTDARVACMRPELSGVHVCGRWTYETWPVYVLCGNISSPVLPDNVYVFPPERSLNGSGPPAEAGLNPATVQSKFVCDIIATQWSRKRRDHDWVLCRLGALDMSGVNLVSMLTNATAYGDYYAELQQGGSRNTLVLNATDIYNQLSMLESSGSPLVNGTTEGAWVTLEAKGDGPWTDQQVQYTAAGEPPRLLNIKTSWCSELEPDSPMGFLDITASTDQPLREEPSYCIDSNTDTFNTTTIREQLLVDSPADLAAASQRRQILRITQEDMYHSLAAVRGKPLDEALLNYRQATDRIFGPGDRGGRTISLQPWAVTRGFAPNEDNVQTTDALLSSIFASTLAATNSSSPARAIQALRTVQARMEYYDTFRGLAGETTATASARVDEEITALAPAGRAGFRAVIGLIVAHVLLFGLVLWLFRRRSRCSFLEQAWPSIGQVATCEDAQGLLLGSTAVTDSQVSLWLKARDTDAGQDVRYQIIDGVVVAKRKFA